MKEEFLQFIWRTKNFTQHDLRTTQGYPLRILDFGMLNRQGGPDFSGCRIEINGTLWAGNVEMHISSSDWIKHGHHTDPLYESVVLHVVIEDDVPVRIGGQLLACIELKSRISGHLLSRYHKLMAIHDRIPCSNLLSDVPGIVQEDCLQKAIVARLESHVSYFDQLRANKSGDWEDVLYIALSKSFGFKSNKIPCERTAENIPLAAIRSIGDKPEEIEALFFGAAGMLNRIFVDPYPRSLQQKYDHLSRKFRISPMDARAWQWGRLRPANFPTIRLSQFSALLMSCPHLARSVLDAAEVGDLVAMLQVRTSDYWTGHTDFDRPCKPRVKRLGKSSAEVIVINTLIPFMFAYGKYRGSSELQDRAVDFLMALPPESNRITREWEQIGMKSVNAGQSQGLIHLKRQYCDKFRCADCVIGHYIMNKSGQEVC